ncbi:MAG: EamA family transporter, partial [archaeon]
MNTELAGILISFAVIILWAVSDLFAKKVIDKIGSRRALFYTQGISAVIYFSLLPFFWGKGPMFSWNFWILSILSGAGNALAWIFYFKALEGGKL